MSKKMKFRTAGALGVMMAGLISMNAYALEDKDVVGTWYVNSMSLDGENTFHPGMMKMEMTFSFTEDGKGEISELMEGQEPGVDAMEWKIDGDKVLITADDQTVEGEYSDGTLSVEMDGLSVVLSQEKEEYVSYVPGKPVAEPKLEDFNGDWTSTLIDLYGMQMPATGEIAGVEMKMSITDGNATLVLLEEGNETTTELKGAMEENALIFNAETQKGEETEADSENYHLFGTDTMRFYLLEDGKLCFTTADSLPMEEETETEAPATEESEDGEDDFGGFDFTIKVYLDRVME